jgi:hypothetical protein
VNILKGLKEEKKTRNEDEDDGSTDNEETLLDRDNCKNNFEYHFIVLTVIVNLMQSSFACYMRLGHYKEAYKCVQYIRTLVPEYIKAYLLECQVVYFNQAATISETRKAL